MPKFRLYVAAAAVLDDGENDGSERGGSGRREQGGRNDAQAITPNGGQTMAIDTRSGTPAGGADDRSGASDVERAPPEQRSPRDSGTADAEGRLVSEMVAPRAAPTEHDRRFDAEALPWIDDVYRFALSLTRDASDADDVVQETYLRAYRSWHTFEPGSDARRWLFTITRNVFLRSRERDRRLVDLEDGDVEALNTFVTHNQMVRDGTDQILSRIDLAPALRRALADLDEPFKSAVILVDLEDQSYEAAAEILDVPIGTVRSRLFRGRRILQDKLLTYARDAGFTTARRAQRGSTND